MAAGSDAQNKQNDELRGHLKCPVCLETCCTPPIHMCANGHHVCARCQPGLTECPTCRSPGMPTLRCSTLEKIALQVRLPCLNWRDGCKKMLNAEDMARHWVGCESRYTYKCFFCSQSGIPKSFHRLKLIDHVKEEHPGGFEEGECTQNKAAVATDGFICYRRLVSAHGELFWILVYKRLQDDSKLIQLFAYCIANNSEYVANKNYDCEIKFCTRGGSVKVSATVSVGSLDLSIHEEMFEMCTTDGHFSFTSRFIRK